MKPPLRKRENPVSKDESQWIKKKIEILGIDYNEYISKEIDIPATDILIDEIEQLFKNNNYPDDYVLNDGSPLKMMKKFYICLDKLVDIYSKYVPCKKGCSKCCDIKVDVTGLEINMIKYYLDENKQKYLFNAIENRHSNRRDYSGIVCPFLKDNICTIYEVRPFMCRKYFVFEDDNSKCGAMNNIVSTFIADYIIERTYEKIVEFYYRQRNINFKDAPKELTIFKDIREYFTNEK